MFGGVGMQKLARVLCLSFGVGVEFRVGGLIDMWVAFKIRVPLALWGGPFYKGAGCRTILGTPKKAPNMENYPCAGSRLGVLSRFCPMCLSEFLLEALRTPPTAATAL